MDDEILKKFNIKTEIDSKVLVQSIRSIMMETADDNEKSMLLLDLLGDQNVDAILSILSNKQFFSSDKQVYLIEDEPQ